MHGGGCGLWCGAPSRQLLEILQQDAGTGQNGSNGEGKGLQIGPTTCWRTFSHRTMTGHDDSEQRVDHSRRKCRSVARCLSPEQTPVCWGRSLEFKDILDGTYLSFPPSLFGLGKGIRRLV